MGDVGYGRAIVRHSGVKAASLAGIAASLAGALPTMGVDVPFTEHVISTTALGPHSVYATDVDGDGDTDVLSASVDDNKIAWMRTRVRWPL